MLITQLKHHAYSLYESTGYPFYISVYEDGKQLFGCYIPEQLRVQMESVYPMKMWKNFSPKKGNHLISKPEEVTLRGVKPYKVGYELGVLRYKNKVIAIHSGIPIRDEAMVYDIFQRHVGFEIPELLKTFPKETLKEIDRIKLALPARL